MTRLAEKQVPIKRLIRAEKLLQKNVSVRVSISGGVAMALAYQARYPNKYLLGNGLSAALCAALLTTTDFGNMRQCLPLDTPALRNPAPALVRPDYVKSK